MTSRSTVARLAAMSTGARRAGGVSAAMDGPARMPAWWAAGCGCVQLRRDGEVIALSFDEMRNAALGDGEGNVHASHDGEADQTIIGPRRSTAIHAK